MASREEYAKWCLHLIEGDDYILDDVMAALYEDGFIDEGNDWVYDEDDE